MDVPAEQYFTGHRTGNGCVFGFACQWSERAGNGPEKNDRGCRRLRRLSVSHADDRMALCPCGGQSVSRFSALYSMDCLDFAGLDRGEDALGGCASSKGTGTQKKLLPMVLLTQGIATSIDALSVGFAIAGDQAAEAALCALIIAAVTFGICMSGLVLGKKVGTRLSGKAEILGGLILIGIGLEIFMTG